MEANARAAEPATAREIQILSRTFLFSGLSVAERRAALGSISPETVAYRPGEAVITAGDPFSAIGLVTEGCLAVTRQGERRPVIHRTLGPGEVFGVSSLFGEGEGFPTTVTAQEPTTVLFLTEAEVRRLITSYPRIAEAYITLLTRKIRFLNGRLDTLAGRSAEERVASYLLTHTEGGLPLTKSALASLLGLGRASLYRILDLFEGNGLIRSCRDAIEVPDRAALESFIKHRKEIKK